MPTTIIETDGNTLSVFLSGDIDHHSAGAVRADIDRALRSEPIELLILDFSAVSFMDSSGIGLVMGRYKLISELGGKCIVANPPAYIAKVMKLSGIGRLCRIVSDRSIRPRGGDTDKQTSTEDTDYEEMH